MVSGKRSVCAVLGCGGGKSVIAAMIAKSATDKGNRVLFIVHRQELCEQISETFAACGVNMNLCHIGMVQTVSRHIADEPEPALIITDEFHHGAATSYKHIYDAFPDAYRLGFTATPQRLGAGGLGDVCDALVESVSTRWLIDNSYLSDYKYYSVKLADASRVHVRAGEYSQPEIARLMENKAIYGDTVSNYKRIADNKKAIVFCASVEASRQTAQKFEAAGYSVAHLDGSTPTAQRQNIMEKFRSGEIKILCNAMLFIEGINVPDCEVSILLRPTKSLTVFIQSTMRCMRYLPNKTAIIIDHVGACYEHGLPDDVREWSLEHRSGKEVGKINIRECPLCYCCCPVNVSVCPSCGAELTSITVKRSDKKVITIDLEEIKREEALKVKPYDEYRKCKTFDELKQFGKARNYKIQWVVRKAQELNLIMPGKYRYMTRYLK